MLSRHLVFPESCVLCIVLKKLTFTYSTSSQGIFFFLNLMKVFKLVFPPHFFFKVSLHVCKFVYIISTCSISMLLFVDMFTLIMESTAIEKS